MWGDYLTSIGENITTTNKNYTSWYFCNDEKSANNLAELVSKGIKRGTSSLYCLYELENLVSKEKNKDIFLYVFVKNKGAVNLYLRNGYKIVENIHDSRYIMKKSTVFKVYKGI